MIATTIFGVYALLVSLAYRSFGGRLLNIALNSFVLLFCIILQGLGVYLFIKATNVFKNAAKEFNLSWNWEIYYIFLVLMIAEVSTTLVWAIMAFSSSFILSKNNFNARQVQLYGVGIVELGHCIIMLAILLN